jgi:hypothetical protein
VTVYNQFWNWVDNHCPYDMSKLQCQACEPNGGKLSPRIHDCIQGLLGAERVKIPHGYCCGVHVYSWCLFHPFLVTTALTRHCFM